MMYPRFEVKPVVKRSEITPIGLVFIFFTIVVAIQGFGIWEAHRRIDRLSHQLITVEQAQTEAIRHIQETHEELIRILEQPLQYTKSSVREARR